jgi:hypothetical protein
VDSLTAPMMPMTEMPTNTMWPNRWMMRRVFPLSSRALRAQYLIQFSIQHCVFHSSCG